MSFLRAFFFCLVIGGGAAYADNPASVSYVNRLLAPGTHQIGDYAEGGVIFWLTTDRKHGLVADIEDIDGGSGVPWSEEDLRTGARATGIVFGADIATPGLLNTQQIILVQEAASPPASYAAKLCSDRSVTVNGVTYDDWYLPDIVELGVIYIRRETINATATAHGGTAFASENYWSSFELNFSSAWFQGFSTGIQSTLDKTSTHRVRAIRAF